MDIAGTKRKLQRLAKVAEESYKKISKLMEQVERLQEDLETTSRQVDHIEYELAEQRVLLEALAEREGIDTEARLAEADLPPEPSHDQPDEEAEADPKQATSRPSAVED